MADNIKQFLNTWCSKNHKSQPVYTIKNPVGKATQRIRFKCEVTVEGYNYIGFGSSTNKKDSQTNAARDFTNFLVREKIISLEEVPQFSQLELVGPLEEQRVVDTGTVYSRERDVQEDRGEADVRANYIENIFDQKKLEEAEDVDFTADIHGGWSLDNAKANLNIYMQKNKVNADYKYTTTGPDHNRSFICELNMYCPQLKKNIYARESGCNKQSASKSCALSAVRQLFHMKIIEAYKGVATKHSSEQIPPFKVQVDPELEKSIEYVIDSLGLTCIEKPPIVTSEDQINMIVNYTITDFEPQVHHRPQIITWAPALPNWNVWTANNIDEGDEAFLTLEEISRRMKDNFMQRRLSDPELRRMGQERERLPASSYEGAVIDAVTQHQIVMIRGETGSGKTTQVPQFILDYFIQLNRGAECNIIVTQPRRISAVSLAERVAQERGESLGQSCGYSVRFDTILPQPYGGILYCTVGTLLRKVEGGLRGVSHIIVDEIHERDCNTDFLMILLRDMACAYPDLKILLMSATIDVELFKAFFPDIFCLEIEGRSFPVNFYFLEDVIDMVGFKPDDIIKKDKKGKSKNGKDQEEMFTTSAKGDDGDINCNLLCDDSYKASTKLAMSKLSEKEICFELIEVLLKHIEGIHPDGAVLIFLPGWNIIQMLLKHLQRSPVYGSPRFVLLALHSQVPREEQRRVFVPCRQGVRKIILATNIAETSITINDVMFVIDSCRAKIKMFTSRNNLTSYNTVWASKTNLEQRRGRAGRVMEGYAFHLCSRSRYDRLDVHTTPEMLRTALHELALMVKLLKLGDTRSFLAKALEQPPLDAIIEAEHLLREMKAFDKNDELTPLGTILARLPIEPRVGKMIIYGCLFGVADACATIAACTSLGDPFVLPPDRKRLSRQQVELAGGRCSDHVAILNAFQKWENVQRRGQRCEEQFCESKGLNLSILKMTREAASQIKNILIGAGFPEESLATQFFDCRSPCANLDNVINLLVLGLYPNVAYHKDKRKVLTTEGKQALIHKSSVNCNNFIQTFPSPFFIFGEKIRTRVIACKQMSMINPLQLLMFGARKVTYENQLIVVDDWLNLEMDFNLAAKILSLRPALESLLVKACINPEMVMNPQADDVQLMAIITRLSDPNVCYHGNNNNGGGVGAQGSFDTRKRRGSDDRGYRMEAPQRTTNYAAAIRPNMLHNLGHSSFIPRQQLNTANRYQARPLMDIVPKRAPFTNRPAATSSRGYEDDNGGGWGHPNFVPPRQGQFSEQLPNKFRASEPTTPTLIKTSISSDYDEFEEDRGDFSNNTVAEYPNSPYGSECPPPPCGEYPPPRGGEYPPPRGGEYPPPRGGEYPPPRGSGRVGGYNNTNRAAAFQSQRSFSSNSNNYGGEADVDCYDGYVNREVNEGGDPFFNRRGMSYRGQMNPMANRAGFIRNFRGRQPPNYGQF